mmetsp:Transcript_11407/g.37678  ORF Transcript_11407/g.37678 Transcript_11407/m.37678 type:complete len:278 (+) Transcript_11407:728-1561(+)
MKSESAPSSRRRFLGVIPPAMYSPPSGTHLRAALAASAPKAVAKVSIVRRHSSQKGAAPGAECCAITLPLSSPAAPTAACTSATTLSGKRAEKKSYIVASPGPEMTRSTETRCFCPKRSLRKPSSSTSSAVRGAQSEWPPSDANVSYGDPSALAVLKHSPSPVPAPTHAIGAPATLGAACSVTHSLASSSVSSPYPFATKSLTSRTLPMPKRRSSAPPSMTQSRLVKETALRSTGPATARQAADGGGGARLGLGWSARNVETIWSKLPKSPLRYCAE